MRGVKEIIPHPFVCSGEGGFPASRSDQRTKLSQYGQPVAGAKVYICNAAASTGLPCTPVVPIYSDYNLTQPIPNPTTTDVNGNFNVYAGALSFPNVYVANMVPQAGTTYTQLYSGPWSIAPSYPSPTLNYIPKVSSTSNLGTLANSSLQDTGSRGESNGNTL